MKQPPSSEGTPRLPAAMAEYVQAGEEQRAVLNFLGEVNMLAEKHDRLGKKEMVSLEKKHSLPNGVFAM